MSERFERLAQEVMDENAEKYILMSKADADAPERPAE